MISAIDGTPVGADLDAAMARMRGPRGSTVKLAVMRTGQSLPLEFTVERAQVDVHSVAMVKLDDAYLYARITMFSETTAEDFAASIARLRRDMNAKPRGVVLDLRNNPGGVLESAVEVADQLLETGVIVTADGRTPAARFTMDATPGEVLPGVPVVVLVNGSTASAAEILAGALQDHHRAVLLGRRTFGKGSVQTVMPLARGPRHQAHHLALLHAVGPLHPGPRHRSRPRRSRTSTAFRSISTTRACARRWQATMPACTPRSNC